MNIKSSKVHKNCKQQISKYVHLKHTEWRHIFTFVFVEEIAAQRTGRCASHETAISFTAALTLHSTILVMDNFQCGENLIGLMFRCIYISKNYNLNKMINVVKRQYRSSVMLSYVTNDSSRVALLRLHARSGENLKSQGLFP